MHSLVQLLVLGFIQGITEFLPISSSGHTALAQYFLHLPTSLTLDIFLNTATLVSVLVYFRKDYKEFIKNLPYLLVGTIPAVIAGISLKDKIEASYNSPTSLAPFFILTGLLLLSTRIKRSNSNSSLTYLKAFLIGLAQACAILPSLSRSASTISIALLLGLSPQTAFTFSFFLLIPASAGALLLDIKKQLHLLTSSMIIPYTLTFIITTLVGYFSLKMCRKFLANQKIWYFGIYTIIVGIMCFLVIK